MRHFVIGLTSGIQDNWSKGAITSHSPCSFILSVTIHPLISLGVSAYGRAGSWNVTLSRKAGIGNMAVMADAVETRERASELAIAYGSLARSSPIVDRSAILDWGFGNVS